MWKEITLRLLKGDLRYQVEAIRSVTYRRFNSGCNHAFESESQGSLQRQGGWHIREIQVVIFCFDKKGDLLGNLSWISCMVKVRQMNIDAWIITEKRKNKT